MNKMPDLTPKTVETTPRLRKLLMHLHSAATSDGRMSFIQLTLIVVFLLTSAGFMLLLQVFDAPSLVAPLIGLGYLTILASILLLASRIPYMQWLTRPRYFTVGLILLSVAVMVYGHVFLILYSEEMDSAGAFQIFYSMSALDGPLTAFLLTLLFMHVGQSRIFLTGAFSFLGYALLHRFLLTNNSAGMMEFAASNPTLPMIGYVLSHVLLVGCWVMFYLFFIRLVLDLIIVARSQPRA